MFPVTGLYTLLNQHGKTLTLKKNTVGSYNPATGTVNKTTTTHSVKGYFFDYVDNMVDGDAVQRGDRRVVLKTVDTRGSALQKPDPDDLITYGGETVKVVKASIIESGGAPKCFLLQVRR